MVKEGPCFHCGIDSTPLWRNGPPEKPVLCNACGSRWRIRGTLDDYIPKHAMKEYQTESFNHSGSDSSPLTSENNSFYVENNSDDTENISEHSEPNFKNIPKRRRSNLDQVVLSPMGRLHKQLYDIAHIPGVISKEPVNENVLIDHVNIMMFTPPETLLGAKLLQSPPKNLQRTESVSSSNAKETLAFGIATNGSDRGDSSST